LILFVYLIWFDASKGVDPSALMIAASWLGSGLVDLSLPVSILDQRV
jgi:hypothetical protein